MPNDQLIRWTNPACGLAARYLGGKLHLDDMVTARVGLDDINEAFAAMSAGEVARSVIVFD